MCSPNYALQCAILKKRPCNTGHFERVPYDRSTVRSAYHTRKYDIHRLSHLTPRSASDENNDQVDIFLSHDWPIGVTRFGDEKALLRKKQFFTEEVGFARLQHGAGYTDHPNEYTSRNRFGQTLSAPRHCCSFFSSFIRHTGSPLIFTSSLQPSSLSTSSKSSSKRWYKVDRQTIKPIHLVPRR